MLLALSTTPALAQQAPAVDPARADAAIKSAFPTAPADWQSRLVPRRDDAAVLGAPQQPAEGRRRRDPAAREGHDRLSARRQVHRRLEEGRESWRSPATACASPIIRRGSANGGNCYACHQLTKAEVSYGTLGPSLLRIRQAARFRRGRDQGGLREDLQFAAALPCSTMPRFGANKMLTIEQIKDAVALLMSPDSPVNK